ncbi:SapC family protein [Sphingomonas koreensis]
MANASPLPLLYKELVPLNSRQHGGWRSRTTDKATWLANQHAIPLTVEEFAPAQRHFPIIFSAGPDPVPLALMGLDEGINVFFHGDCTLPDEIYIPAYARRYPFLLAKLSEENADLSLCLDPTTDLVGEFADGTPLFENDTPSESCKATLDFCERFEIAGQKTKEFVAELGKHDLLIDGEVTIQPEGGERPFIYRGFRMVNETKLREVDGEVLRAWNESGLLPLIFFHLASLPLMRDILVRQIRLGLDSVPAPQAGSPVSRRATPSAEPRRAKQA